MLPVYWKKTERGKEVYSRAEEAQVAVAGLEFAQVRVEKMRIAPWDPYPRGLGGAIAAGQFKGLFTQMLVKIGWFGSWVFILANPGVLTALAGVTKVYQAFEHERTTDIKGQFLTRQVPTETTAFVLGRVI